MEFALSQEGDKVKLFIQKIKWEDLLPAFKDDIVNVKQFVIMMESDFVYNQSASSVHLHEVKLRKQSLAFGEIKNQFIKEKPLKKFKWVDVEKLKAEYPKLVEKGLSPEEIWEHHITLYVKGGDLIKASIENNDFQLTPYWTLDAFCITFLNRKKLLDFLEIMDKNFKEPAIKELKIAEKERRSYATQKLKSDFNRAGNFNRMKYFIQLREGNK